MRSRHSYTQKIPEYEIVYDSSELTVTIKSSTLNYWSLRLFSSPAAIPQTVTYEQNSTKTSIIKTKFLPVTSEEPFTYPILKDFLLKVVYEKNEIDHLFQPQSDIALFFEKFSLNSIDLSQGILEIKLNQGNPSLFKFSQKLEYSVLDRQD